MRLALALRRLRLQRGRRMSQKKPGAAGLRFMGWLASYCSPFGVEVGNLSPVISQLERGGYIARHEKKVVLTGKGWRALHEDGFKAVDE